LGFEETPDYDHLRGLMSKVLQKIDVVEDSIYDWMLLDKDKLQRVSIL
jgi:casein kinase 1